MSVTSIAIVGSPYCDPFHGRLHSSIYTLGENQKQVSTVSHTPLEISPKTRDSHFSTAPTKVVISKEPAKATTTAKAKPNSKAVA